MRRCTARRSRARDRLYYESLTLDGLTDAQIRLRPGDNLNSLAWLVWHMARCEDVAMNVAIADQPQVLDEGWTTKLGVDRDDIGTGMTPREVATLSEQIDLDALLSYRHAVGRQTREVIAAIDDADIAAPDRRRPLPPGGGPRCARRLGRRHVVSLARHGLPLPRDWALVPALGRGHHGPIARRVRTRPVSADPDDDARRATLRAVVDSYFDGMHTHDLTAVPWHSDVRLHTPIGPGGPAEPIVGAEQVRAFFDAIGPAISSVEVRTVYFSDDLRSVAAHATIDMAEPACQLRVLDRFEVDDLGRITEQENHFDPRPAMP